MPDHDTPSPSEPVPTSHAQHSLGATAIAGLFGTGIEVFTGQPGDTINKRLQHSRTLRLPSQNAFQYYNTTLFGAEAASMSSMAKFISLYAGLRSALIYKIPQRTLKIGGSMYLDPLMLKYFEKYFPEGWDNITKKFFLGGIKGIILGLTEVAILPLDLKKVREQVEKRRVSLSGMVREEGWGVYRGAKETAIRNSIGSFFFFSAEAMAKAWLPQLGFPPDNVHLLNAFSAAFGSFMSIVIPAPVDLIKTRIQTSKEPITALQLIRSLIANEGARAFWKGTVPKLIFTIPKQTAGFTAGQWAVKHISDALGAKNPSPPTISEPGAPSFLNRLGFFTPPPSAAPISRVEEAQTPESPAAAASSQPGKL